ncbi:MAG: hypothetical protein IPJ03_01990 [Ignavibacteriales bacterium]|nr:hypothetical protein [Ignavibacteriales bacterium]
MLDKIKKSWKKFKVHFTNFKSLYAFLLFVGLPITLFIISIILSSINQKEKFNKFFDFELSWPFLIACSFLIVYIFLLIITSWGGSFFKRANLWTSYMLEPLIVAAPMAMLMVTIYLFSANSIQQKIFESHFASVLGIYLTVIGIVIGFYGLFSSKLQILNIDTFMDSLIFDLATIKKRFFWCYPGLSFGSISATGKRYVDFKAKLITNIFFNKDIEKNIFLFDEDQIEKFYKPYEDNAIKLFSSKPKELQSVLGRIKKAKEDSYFFILLSKQAVDIKSLTLEEQNILLKKITIEDHEQLLGNLTCRVIDHLFRFQVIIIDETSYILTPLGLPQKFNDDYEFTHDTSSIHPVNFIVTKIVGKNQADELINQIEREYLRFKEIREGETK